MIEKSKVVYQLPIAEITQLVDIIKFDENNNNVILYWVGCVSAANKNQFNDFINLAKSGDIGSLMVKSSIGGDRLCAYVIHERDSDIYCLIIILVPDNPDSPKMIQEIKFINDISIEPAESDYTDQNSFFLKDPKLGLFEILGSLFKAKNHNNH